MVLKIQRFLRYKMQFSYNREIIQLFIVLGCILSERHGTFPLTRWATQRAKFTEENYLRVRLKEKRSFAGHSIFKKFYFKIQPIYIRANV